MTYFDKQKEFEALFEENFPHDKRTVTFNFKPNISQLNVSVKAVHRNENTIDSSITTKFNYEPWRLAVKTEFSTPDENEKILSFSVKAQDVFTKGVTGGLDFTNGTKGELTVGGEYKNNDFGVTGRFGLSADSKVFMIGSLQFQHEQLKGVSVGAVTKITKREDEVNVFGRAVGTYKTSNFSVFVGGEKKEAENEEEEPTTSIVGGLLKEYAPNKVFGLNANYNIKSAEPNFEVLFKKVYEDDTSMKFKVGMDGNVAVSKFYKIASGSFLAALKVNTVDRTCAVGFSLVSDI